MKTQFQTIRSAAVISFYAFTAVAQNTPDPKSRAPEYNNERAIQMVRGQHFGIAEKATVVLGMEVKNYQDEKLGKVDDLVMEVETGRIVHALISVGGFLGIGDTLVAVPPGALHTDTANKVIHLDATKEKLKSAPKFEMSKWDESTQSNRVAEVYRYYGERPYFATTEDGYRNSDRLSARDSWSTLGRTEKASKLIGMPVKNHQDEKLGKIDNLIVDLMGGRIVHVILSTGGFLGLGDELSAVPPMALHFNAERNTLQLDTTKEALSNAPHFKANEWPALTDPVYADRVYRSYQIEPYFTTNSIADADNTARNVRDRNSQTVTPLDQGSSASDISITKRIRKEITAEKGLSVNARNVKVITSNGKVTLRGPVNTSEEKRLISEIADRIAQTENVDNQLEVKDSTSSKN